MTSPSECSPPLASTVTFSRSMLSHGVGSGPELERDAGAHQRGAGALGAVFHSPIPMVRLKAMQAHTPRARAYESAYLIYEDHRLVGRRQIDPDPGFNGEFRIGFSLRDDNGEACFGNPRPGIADDPTANGRVAACQ